MQTFVPLEGFVSSAACLDRQRLGKQRVECMQLLKAMFTEKQTGWKQHPATLMWAEHPDALFVYSLIVCHTWVDRGYNDTVGIKIPLMMKDFWPADFITDLCEIAWHVYKYPSDVYRLVRLPDWWNGPIHASHRSNLLRKDPVFYSQFGWTEPDNLEYVWPSKGA